MKLTLNQKLSFEFSRLDIKGTNIETFYSYCFEMFLFENSELSKREKIEAIQINDKSEITIQKVLSERTFIQDQIIRCEGYLKESIHPDNREKLNIWIEYLRKKINKPEKTQMIQTFESIFRDKDNAKKIKDIFELKGYTINGKWQGLTKVKSELLSAYYILKPLLKPGLKDTPTAKIFYSEFGLPDDYISPRMLRKEPNNYDITDEFEKIFKHLLSSLN